MVRNVLPQKRPERERERTFPRMLRGLVWRLCSGRGHQRLLEWNTRPVMKTTKNRERRVNFSTLSFYLLLQTWYSTPKDLLCLAITILRKPCLRENASEDAQRKKKSDSVASRLSSAEALIRHLFEDIRTQLLGHCGCTNKHQLGCTKRFVSC